VIHNPSDPNMLGIKNNSSFTWKINLPDGSQRPLPPGNVVPTKDGFEIDFIGNAQTAAKVEL